MPRRAQQVLEEIVCDEGEFLCHGCRSVLPDTDCQKSYTDGNNYCSDCFNEKFVICAVCDEELRRDDDEYYVPDDTGEPYCPSCYEEYYTTCFHCGVELRFSSNYTYQVRDRYMCSDCYCENYCSCDSCGATIRNEESRYSQERDEYYCPDCFDELDERSDGINAYDYKPSPTFYDIQYGKEYRDSSPRDRDRLYFGIELETEVGNARKDRGTIAEEVTEKLDFVYAKDDGSLSCGIEFVTHPLSWYWLKENSEKFYTLFNLSSQGVKSYDTNSCGIHVHMSKAAFTVFHLYKFMKLFFENEKFIRKLSQRKDGYFDEWSKINPDEKRAQKYMARNKMSYTGSKYVAINLNNEKSVEIRIFRGTLKPESFFKNLEFLHAAFQFTKNAKVKDITVEKFWKFILRNKYEYNNLYEFIQDKFSRSELEMKPVRVSNQHRLEDIDNGYRSERRRRANRLEELPFEEFEITSALETFFRGPELSFSGNNSDREFLRVNQRAVYSELIRRGFSFDMCNCASCRGGRAIA